MPQAEARALQFTIPPDQWCVTREDLDDLVARVREEHRAGRMPQDPRYPDPYHDDEWVGPNMHAVNRYLIKPTTEAAGGMCWALMRHPNGLPVHFFATHAWNEGIYEFHRKVIASWPRGMKHMWFCCLANPQSWEEPELAKLLAGDPTVDSPFAKALSRAKMMLVVPNSAVSIYSRLWCVLEVKLAMEQGMRVVVATEGGDRRGTLELRSSDSGRSTECNRYTEASHASQASASTPAPDAQGVARPTDIFLHPPGSDTGASSGSLVSISRVRVPSPVNGASASTIDADAERSSATAGRISADSQSSAYGSGGPRSRISFRGSMVITRISAGVRRASDKQQARTPRVKSIGVPTQRGSLPLGAALAIPAMIPEGSGGSDDSSSLRDSPRGDGVGAAAAAAAPATQVLAEYSCGGRALMVPSPPQPSSPGSISVPEESTCSNSCSSRRPGAAEASASRSGGGQARSSGGVGVEPSLSTSSPSTRSPRQIFKQRYNAFVKQFNQQFGTQFVGTDNAGRADSAVDSPGDLQSRISAPDRMRGGRHNPRFARRLRRKLLTDFTTVRDAKCTNPEDERRIREAIAGQEDFIDNMIRNVIIRRGRGKWKNASMAVGGAGPVAPGGSLRGALGGIGTDDAVAGSPERETTKRRTLMLNAAPPRGRGMAPRATSYG